MHKFANYYGSKWKLARLYGRPKYDLVIEPFAGFAGYSTYWEPKSVVLIERDPIIVGVFRYLQRVSRAEFMSLPTEVETLEDLHSVCEEARNLIGFWFDAVPTKPDLQRHNWARQAETRHCYWGQQIRRRIADQLDRISHWKIVHGSYADAPDKKAHWLIDPPYKRKGYCYNFNQDQIDYQKLAEWCKSRRGYVQVCEQAGADWLPFRPFRVVGTPRAFSHEVIYEFENNSQPNC